MIIGTGIDLIETARIEKAIQSKRFIQKIFTANEIKLFESRNFRVSTVAGNFAAKEAVMKAFGCGFSSGLYQDIEVLRKTSGEPYVNLKGKALLKFQACHGKAIHLSLSNLKSLVCAQAIIESE